MRLAIEPMRGTWRAQSDSRTYFDDTLEGLLVQLAPDAPEEYLWHTAEVLGSILGAEVVEVPRNIDPDITRLLWNVMTQGSEELEAAITAEADSLREQNGEEPWQPTEEQQAYFEPERTEEVQNFTAPEIEDARPTFDAGAEGV